MLIKEGINHEKISLEHKKLCPLCTHTVDHGGLRTGTSGNPTGGFSPRGFCTNAGGYSAGRNAA
jgi:hypothetical protein